ncbi:MAG: iron ABC transporter permease [Clostridia bacterium]
MLKKSNFSSKKQLYILLLAVITIVFAVFSLVLGYYNLTISQVFEVLIHGKSNDPNAYTIIYNIRLPRIVAALLIGMSLSVSGSAYQGMFKNPLVSPDILGVSSGASAGAAFAIILGKSSLFIQIFAFLGGFIAVIMSYLISLKSRHSQTITLVLTGTMIGGLASAFVTVLKYVSTSDDKLSEITFWLMGSLNGVRFKNIQLAIFPMILGFLIIFLYRWKLNLLMFSDNEAKSMGINPKRTKFVVIFAATLLSASAVCLGGLIGWVGLIIPHITRFLFGANYHHVIPASAVLGALFLLIMDTIARSVFATEIPLGVLTAFAGTPFFIGLILWKNNSNIAE